MSTTNQLTCAADAFLFVEVEHCAVRTIVADLLTAVTSVIRAAMALRRRVVKVIGMVALVIDILRIHHVYDDR